MTAPLRVGISALSLLVPHTGIGSYTRNLGNTFLAMDGVDARFFYGYGWSAEVRQAGLSGAATLRTSLLKMIPRPYWLARLGVQQRCFTSGARKLGFDVYHEPAFFPFRFVGTTVITIHDLSPLRHPQTHPIERVRQFEKRLPWAAGVAAKIIVDSHFVKREVMDLLRVDESRIRPVHLGVGAEYHPRPATATERRLATYGLAHGGYVLAVGTLEPRKNLVEALEAHAQMSEAQRRRFPLVIAGPKGWLAEALEKRIAAAERRGEVRWLGYVPSTDLPLLYAGARLLVYPSLYEGFGLPVLEAMASGVPVVASNRASIPEVAGDAAVMIEPGDAARLREAMLRLLEDEREAMRRATLGLAQAARFSWQACADQTLQIYREALGAA